MKNRKSLKWRDNRQLEIGKPGDFTNLTTDELREQVLRDLAETAALIDAMESNAPTSDTVN